MKRSEESRRDRRQRDLEHHAEQLNEALEWTQAAARLVGPRCIQQELARIHQEAQRTLRALSPQPTKEALDRANTKLSALRRDLLKAGKAVLHQNALTPRQPDASYETMNEEGQAG